MLKDEANNKAEKAIDNRIIVTPVIFLFHSSAHFFTVLFVPEDILGICYRPMLASRPIIVDDDIARW